MKLTHKNISNKEGFTLIEIIIVVIIVGILASLAVPKFAQQMENSKAGEAFSMIGAFSRAVDRCVATNTVAVCLDDTNADSWADLIDMDKPVSKAFTYTTTNTAPTPGAGAPTCTGDAFLVATESTGNEVFGCITSDGSAVPVITGTGDYIKIATKANAA